MSIINHRFNIAKAKKKILVLPVTGFKKTGSVGRLVFLENIYIHSVELRASKSVHPTFF